MRRTAFLILILLVLVSAFTACTAQGTQGAGYKKISAEDAKAIIGQDDVILVDVRTPEEYAQGHIPQARLLPLDTISEDAYTVLPDKDAVIIVYCRSGSRSSSAARQLIDMGYTDVNDLGGIINWPYETVTGN